MTIKQFRELDEMEQHEAMWDNGVMVGDRLEGEHRIVLYQIFDFYLELYLSYRIKCFAKISQL